MNQSLVAYLDHQIWCGTAERSPTYLTLRDTLERAADLQNVFVPYSIVHVQELAEFGKISGLSRAERIEKAMPTLEFIKKISRSLILKTNDDYSNFTLDHRDPIEAFETLTEVELDAASTHNFTDFIPKTMVQEIQSVFAVGAKRLNNMTEEEAIEQINSGFKSFVEKCQSDRDFHRTFVDASKKQSEQLVLKGHSQSLSALDQAKQIALQGLKEGNLNEEEKQSVQKVISTLELQKVQLEEQLPSQIQAVLDSCEKSYSTGPLTYSFDLLLDQIDQFAKGKSLPRSLNKTILLDFFGYKSKLGNRRSDYYDAIHREYAKVCNCFVTDDSKLQEKLGALNGPIVGTKCLLLNSVSFEQTLLQALSSMKVEQKPTGRSSK